MFAAQPVDSHHLLAMGTRVTGYSMAQWQLAMGSGGEMSRLEMSIQLLNHHDIVNSVVNLMQ